MKNSYVEGCFIPQKNIFLFKKLLNLTKNDNLPYEHRSLEDEKYGNVNIGYHNRISNKNKGNANFVVPVQYQLKGEIPPVYYVDSLMDYVGKTYYVGLLSAATIHGASHQRAMKTQVVTIEPRIKASGKNPFIDWNYRKEIPNAFVLKKNAEIGTLRYSGPELTAIDLVQFSAHVGGYQRAATVLAELMDSVNMEKVVDLLPFTTVATLQRFGYLLEFVLLRQNQADMLFQILKKQGSWNSVLLCNEHDRREGVPVNRWHVNGNIDIEVDDL